MWHMNCNKFVPLPIFLACIAQGVLSVKHIRLASVDIAVIAMLASLLQVMPNQS